MSERKLVGTNEMFKKALAGGYAIGAYNVNNMEILQAIAEAAEETKNNASLPGIRQKTPHKTCDVFCIPSDKFGNTTRKRSVFSCQICFAFSASRPQATSAA